MVRRDRCQRRLQIDFLAWGTGSVSRVADNRIGCSHDLLVFDGVNRPSLAWRRLLVGAFEA
jgi:hypothetical protein